MTRRILWNALTTLGQTIGSAATLFFLYRFLIRTIGVERLGIWSLVLATTSVVTLANQGFSTSIVKFVAKYAAREQPRDVALLIQTALLSTITGLSVASLGFYAAARWVLRVVLPHATLPEALKILPIALASVWITILLSILQAGLVGHEAIALCNYVELGGSIAYLALAYLLVPRGGLVSLAYAQLIQGAASLLITGLLLHRAVPELPFIPRRFHRALFRELATYGIQFQLITASQALREPVTKALLARFGGLSLTAYYDMASRCVVTLRESLVQASQVLIPTISRLQERDPQVITKVYRESYRLMLFLAVPSFAALTILSSVVSRLWLGRNEPIFVSFIAILAAGWLVNVLANPAYVTGLGTGALEWISVGCVSTAILNAGLGFFGGRYFGGTAIVSASAFSLALGYVIVLAAFHIENHLSFTVLMPRESSTVLLASVASLIAFALFLRRVRAHHEFISPAGGAAAMLALIAAAMWLHPIRKRLVRWALGRQAA